MTRRVVGSHISISWQVRLSRHTTGSGSSLVYGTNGILWKQRDATWNQKCYSAGYDVIILSKRTCLSEGLILIPSLFS